MDHSGSFRIVNAPAFGRTTFISLLPAVPAPTGRNPHDRVLLHTLARHENGAARVAGAAIGRALRDSKVVRPSRCHSAASSALVSRCRAMPGRRPAFPLSRALHAGQHAVPPPSGGPCRPVGRRSLPAGPLPSEKINGGEPGGFTARLLRLPPGTTVCGFRGPLGPRCRSETGAPLSPALHAGQP